MGGTYRENASDVEPADWNEYDKHAAGCPCTACSEAFEPDEEDVVKTTDVPHPFSIVFGLLMAHVHGVGQGNGKALPSVDEKCCRPFMSEDPGEAVVDERPGREAQGRFAMLPPSQWPMLGAGQTEPDKPPKAIRPAKFKERRARRRK